MNLLEQQANFNRDNYYFEVGYESFKESSGVDYGADTVLGLQLKADYDNAKSIGESQKLHDEAESANPRQVELKVIKNGMFKSGGKVQFNYYPQYDCFVEC
ncbi:MAG: hypothetical protein LBN01_00505 [Endomicrobium sp.]|jgi:hypothetical protein|nr:hypothetical protein [Endomicrobium sp.]